MPGSSTGLSMFIFWILITESTRIITGQIIPGKLGGRTQQKSYERVCCHRCCKEFVVLQRELYSFTGSCFLLGNIGVIANTDTERALRNDNVLLFSGVLHKCTVQ